MKDTDRSKGLEINLGNMQIFLIKMSPRIGIVTERVGISPFEETKPLLRGQGTMKKELAKGNFKVLLKNKKRLLNKRLREIIPLFPRLATTEIGTNYGSIWFTNLFCNGASLLKYLEKYLTKERYANAKEKIEKNLSLSDTGEVELGLLGDYPNENILSAITGDERIMLDVLSKHPNLLKDALTSMWLYTKPLPRDESGMHHMLSEIKMWDDTYHRELGPIYESIWYQGWTDEEDEIVGGLAVKIRFVTVPAHWTLSSFEERIDRAIDPIKKYLTKKGVGPNAEPGSPFSEKCLLCGVADDDKLIWVGICPNCYDRL